MACGSNHLSTRMSSGDQNRDHKQICEVARKHFRKCKVEISDAIQHTFPFLELLRDHEFITNETYEESQASISRKRFSVQEVVYNVLSKLEATFHLSILEVLFCKVMMKNYPNLKCIYKSFRYVIPDKKIFPEIAGEEREERPAIQPNFEQGTGENACQFLNWSSSDPWNYNGTTPPESEHSEHLSETEQINTRRKDTTSDNNEALESQQASEQCAQEPEPAGKPE
ncbi:PREDICTED: nuclear autoantigen Sp-100-like isoform X1 [Hipposideros armiger]|uniref:Nuclear autoantigen Sp-100-like isoform X1 n=1 Tax=Hipposideros armiger TaxID=186990 RepID=A0A8B7QQP8_HIPAR|nr:PREDICTED: nuclear autoantigen Sp-100-like isoform X1 [Hipposideros armiger]